MEPAQIRATILVWVDDPDQFRWYRGVLEAEGYDVVSAPSAQKASELINGQFPDVILFDAGESPVPPAGILEKAAERDLPIVTVVSSADTSAEEKVPGICRVIYKPCRPRTFLEAIEDALRYRF